MIRKLGLVGAVGVAWLLTFALMGRDVLPALSSNDPDPMVTASVTPTGQALARTTPNDPPATTATPESDAPGKDAVTAEALAGNAPVAGHLLAARPKPRRSAPPVLVFRMATYNMLGSSHTAGRGGRASGPARAARGARYVQDNGLSVIGFQEMQANQRSTFKSATGNKYALYPDSQLRGGDGDNSIAWRLDTWKLIKATTLSVPYFHGRSRNSPVLLLRNKQTGINAYFTNFHNPADKFGNASRWRSIAKGREIALFNQLAKTGRPVFVTGDMNEHRTFGCQIVTNTDMRMAAGGDGRNGCSVQTNRIVDWIGGSYAVQFTKYYEDRGPVVDYLTDHPIIWTEVRIDSRDFPRSVN